MSSQSLRRLLLLSLLCFATFILVVKFNPTTHSNVSSSSSTSKQLWQSSNIPASIANTTLGFQKIFVINAPWRSDRRDFISLAASYTDLSLEWIDGVNASDIPDKAYPPGNHKALPNGILGCWRAHMNALREIIERNLTTAIIMEDDADWDFRVRHQLTDLGRATHRLPNLISKSNVDEVPSHETLSPLELAKRSSVPLSSLSACNGHKNEPYGRAWDVLWLGHCGASLPPPSTHAPDMIRIENDETVPQPQHLRPTTNSPLDAISSLYPPHTRVVHRANATLCMIAYAVTQSGARKLLYEFGIREFDRGYDFALSNWCNGLTRGAKKETLPMCLTVQPPLFSHYFAERANSDISGTGIGGRPQEGSRYIRWSVKRNLERLVRGGREMVEQWVNEEHNEA